MTAAPSPGAVAAAEPSEADAAALASPFVRALVRQLRAHDITGAWERKSDAELLAPYVITREQRRAAPVIADPNAKQLFGIEQMLEEAAGRRRGATATPATGQHRW